jgi:type III secretion system (T3SS) SseB-like protein
MMTEETPLDIAHAAMEAAPQDDAARLRFYERIADSELFLMLTEEARGDNLSPETFDLDDGGFVVVFDREDRLAVFAGRPVPYAAVSGRVIAQMLAGQGVGLGLNLEVAPSSVLIPSEAIGWLHQTLGNTPEEVEDNIAAFTAPVGLPEIVLTALDTKLATAVGLAGAAYLVGVEYRSGGRGHMLGFVDAREGAESALAKAVGEALTFSGIEAGTMDVGFFRAGEDTSARLARVGLRFDLPQPEEPRTYAPQAPGSDPDAPPRLK